MSNKVTMLTEHDELKLEKNIVWVFGLTDPVFQNGYFPEDSMNVLCKKLSRNENKLLLNPLICKDLGSLKVGVKSVKTVLEWRNDADYFFSKRYSNTWKLYLRKLILNRIHAQFQDLSNKIIICESTGIGTSLFISECMPKSKIIFLLQNDSSAIEYFTNHLMKDKKQTFLYLFNVNLKSK